MLVPAQQALRIKIAAACLALHFAVVSAGQVLAADPGAAPQEDVAACPAGSDEFGIELVAQTPEGDVRQYEKLELEIKISGMTATNPYWPFDPDAPAGVAGVDGITVRAVFEAPDGERHSQPAFYRQEFLDDIKQNKDWIYPTDSFSWQVRFTPDIPGAWKVAIEAAEKCGSASTASLSFNVVPSDHRGFVRVSRTDSRYFEFEDGSLFHPVGFEATPNLENPQTQMAPLFERLSGSGVNLVRIWISSIYGSAWHTLLGGRNQYRGYLPSIGLVPVAAKDGSGKEFAMRLDYETGGDMGWFDACRMEWLNLPAIKRDTSYRVAVEYMLEELEGPRRRDSPNYGLVAKLGGWHADCYNAGTSELATVYGRSVGKWSTVSGVWFSGDNDFLPNLHVALENVSKGAAYVRNVSIREVFRDGGLGPEVRPKASMQFERYLSQSQAWAFDRIVAYAERAGVQLKVVLLEKGDELWVKLDDDGGFIAGDDNTAGFYGVGRRVNKTRWLQMAWWRYAQARWGYSTAIHSWELLNEGDPESVRHYEMADEFGKYMHEGVFSLDADSPSPAAGTNHADRHLVTTSFWHSFPTEFWANSAYANIDYADLHAYVSTSFAPASEKPKMMGDAAYFHLWHSRRTAAAALGKPVVRGEAGLDLPNSQEEDAAGVQRDADRLWLHNYLWATLDAGALGEIYWWSSHVWNRERSDLAPFTRLSSFLSDVPLNAGGYEDWSGSSSNPAIRVVGQKNVAAGRAHLWIQNAAHTWKNAVDGVDTPAASAAIRVPGFPPGAVFEAERWDTRSGSPTDSHEDFVGPDGAITIAVDSLTTDLAVKIRVAPRAEPASSRLRSSSR